ncbi:MAG: hypothetical protein RL071_2296 [Pseudomonadota bacterium]
MSLAGVRPLRVLHVASEALPWCKTGGLADVVGALPAALQAAGGGAVRVGTLLPLYPQVRAAARALGLRLVDTGARPRLRHRRGAKVWTVRQPGPPVFFLELRGIFDRPTLYGPDQSAYAAQGYEDNVERFALLCEAAVEAGDQLMGGPVGLFHAHDWQAAALPGLLADRGRSTPSLLTVHNLAYTGSFGPTEALGLPLSAAMVQGPYQLEGRGSLLAGGLALATAISTVSPSYAAQIQGPAEGGALAPLLAARGVVGVANGLDQAAWDPARDPHLPQPFSDADLSGKGAARRAALAHFGVLDAPDELVLGVVARLVPQKGLDLLLDLLPVLPQLGARLLILGEGDPGLAAALRAGVEGSRRRAGLIVGFDEGLAHRIIAGADVLLVPSRFEPCGLTQLAAQANGTVPLVHPTGGLRDTVDDPGDEGLRAGRGSGLWMEAPTGGALVAAVGRAAALQRMEPAVWAALRLRIMGLPLGWEAPARAYLGLYAARTGAPGLSAPA